jgi:hypothetical protein
MVVFLVELNCIMYFFFFFFGVGGFALGSILIVFAVLISFV